MITYDEDNIPYCSFSVDVSQVLKVLNYVQSLQTERGAEVLGEGVPERITCPASNEVRKIRKRKCHFRFRKWLKRKLYRLRKLRRRIKRRLHAGGSGSARSRRGGSPRRGAPAAERCSVSAERLKTE